MKMQLKPQDESGRNFSLETADSETINKKILNLTTKYDFTEIIISSSSIMNNQLNIYNKK